VSNPGVITNDEEIKGCQDLQHPGCELLGQTSTLAWAQYFSQASLGMCEVLDWHQCRA